MKIISDKEIRLDKYLADTTNESRNQIENLIKNGYVKVNNIVINKNGYKLKNGDTIDYEFTQAVEEKSLYFDKELSSLDIEIIYEDSDVMVINKPAGLVVHEAPSVKEPTLVDWLKFKNITLSTISGEERHGIVHRLDKVTSGAMVIAKNNDSHTKLSKQLENKSMGRYYLALIDTPLKEDCIVEKPIGRNPNNRLKMDIIENGRDSKTAFKKLSISKTENIELIVAKLFSGRTHQIRVHLNSLNRHILSDTLYGYGAKKYLSENRIYLHAYLLYFNHPRTGEKLHFIASLKSDMNDMLINKFEKDDYEKKIAQEYILSLFS